MRSNFWTKTLAVTAVSGAVMVGGAGMASADTWDGSRTSADETVTNVSDNQLVDGGNTSIGDTLNDAVDVGDVASGNNVLNGVDADVTGVLAGILSGNHVDADANPDVDTDVDGGTSLDSVTDSGNGNEGFLGLF
jgi:hypothetical protein